MNKFDSNTFRVLEDLTLQKKVERVFIWYCPSSRKEESLINRYVLAQANDVKEFLNQISCFYCGESHYFNVKDVLVYYSLYGAYDAQNTFGSAAGSNTRG